MRFADKLNQLTDRAKDVLVEKKPQVEQAVEKAAVLADQRTGGKYRDRIAKAKAKADAFLDDQAQRPETNPPPAETTPQRAETTPAPGETGPPQNPTGTP